MSNCECKILTRIGVFISSLLIIVLTSYNISEYRNLDAKLYILELLMENKPKLENEELVQKVNEIYNIVSGK